LVNLAYMLTMKPIFSLILLLICVQSLSQETKQLFISCDVLGKKNEHVRYYHPVEGEYQVKLKNHYLPNKKDAKALSSFVLINPQDYLKDSLTMVQANSLRHQIELDELIYVNWGLGVDSMNNQAKLDSFSNAACYQRDKKYAGIVQDYFNPFLMSRFEVTNAEYREFVEWVKDSIIREKIYLNSDPTGNDRIDDEIIGEMLVHPDQYFINEELVDYDPSIPEINRGLYPLNWDFDWKKEIKAHQYVPLMSDMYLRPNERWYKRRQLDTKRLIYKFYSIEEDIIALNKSDDSINNRRYILEHEIPVYSDTTDWKDVKGFDYLNSAAANMYYWHPAYDNYPVVGLSFMQIQACLHWKQKKMKKEYPELMSHYELTLPNLREIEWSINSSISKMASIKVGDDAIITDLLIGLENDAVSNNPNLLIPKFLGLTERVWGPVNIQDKKEVNKIIKRYKGLYDNVLQDDIMRDRLTQNSLKNRIEFLSNNVSEWIDMDYKDYEKLLDAYTNYHCFADIDYCQYQRPLDANKIAKNDKDGKLIMGSNWYDERYENTLGVNTGGIYPKRFADKDSSFATVGFRLVLRLKKV
jgi:hypothetical protein